jgi:hypothetical protein
MKKITLILSLVITLVSVLFAEKSDIYLVYSGISGEKPEDSSIITVYGKPEGRITDIQIVCIDSESGKTSKIPLKKWPVHIQKKTLQAKSLMGISYLSIVLSWKRNGKFEKTDPIIVSLTGYIKEEGKMKYNHIPTAAREPIKEDVAYDHEISAGMSYAAEEVKSHPKKFGAAASDRSAAGFRKSIKRREVNNGVSGLRAGYSDDNVSFGAFIDFLDKYKNTGHVPCRVTERFVFAVQNEYGQGIPDADVTIFQNSRKIVSGKTYADGMFMFFPEEHKKKTGPYKAVFSYYGKKKQIIFSKQDTRKIEVRMETEKRLLQKVPVDLVFVLDTTGSMGEEINRLKKTIELIHLNVKEGKHNVDLRLAMVVYKDKRDVYRTQITPFTTDLQKFQEVLTMVSASGGGDGPEDLESALFETVHSLSWRKSAVRLAYIITDAPPHLDYNLPFNYNQTVRAAKHKGIKLFGIGTGGLNINGEYVLRQLSQYTGGSYIFLHYGERGESDGGAPGSVSHHTGVNFNTGKLESIILHFTRKEINAYAGNTDAAKEEFFEAESVAGESAKKTLSSLFSQALSHLINVSSRNLKKGTSLAVMPVKTSGEGSLVAAEYISENLLLSVTSGSHFEIVERNDMSSVMKEFELIYSGMFTSEKKLSGLTGADVLLLGKIFYKGDDAELYLKLVYTETGEVLSVTKTIIREKLIDKM